MGGSSTLRIVVQENQYIFVFLRTFANVPRLVIIAGTLHSVASFEVIDKF